MDDVSVLILAGGKSRRFSKDENSIPKFLYPLNQKECLLTKLLDLLKSANLNKRYICLSNENYRSTKNYLDASIQSRGKLELVKIDDTEKGPISAIQKASQIIDSEWLLICLADIYFEISPDISLSKILNSEEDLDGILFSGNNMFSKKEVISGQILIDKNKKAKDIHYLPKSFDKELYKEELWTGMFLIKSKYISSREDQINNFSFQPLESLIQNALNHKARLDVINVGNYINVNYPEEYDFLKRKLGS